jgi:hypothetical protein
MSQEHENPNPDTPVSDGIHPEAAPFEPGYQPGTLPQINVPDLAEDAKGLSAEALANVPTLTELVEPDPVLEDVPVAPAEIVEPSDLSEAPMVPESTEALACSAESDASVQDEPAQDEPAQADTWGEQLQVRIGKLNDDIHTLNVRLDRLEERNKTKV